MIEIKFLKNFSLNTNYEQEDIIIIEKCLIAFNLLEISSKTNTGIFKFITFIFSV